MVDLEPDWEQLIRRWEQLTSRETDAIQAEAWDAVTEAQRQKTELQTRLGQTTRPLPPRLRSAAARLIELERRNAETLARRIMDLRHQVARLDAAGRNLRRVQRSYSPPRPPAAAFSSVA